ncbi:succinic semialdehyde dehydrogenase [Amycolatopsis nigrescens]|uniref:succinic semialdehyde dehydrogenase n=1 Tax=Amycolatopsis nigrescens TaxID=381445 RepID=UPI00037192D9|nr:succinic semialdehyde dehydrogenase [Amycolatopsis nigrescens]
MSRLHPVSGLPASITPDLLDRLTARVVASDAPVATTVAVFTGEPYVDLPRSTPDDVARAVEHARKAQTAWAATDVPVRARVLRRFHNLLLERQDVVLDLIQVETGKARRHAFEESLEPALTAGYYLRKGAKALQPKRREGMLPGLVRTTELRQPKGVVGVISPWNYPFALGISDTLPALLAGNGVVLKPDTQTALSPLYGVELLYEAGLPEGLLQPVLGEGPVVGTAVVEQADYVGFTGSTRTGRDVAQRAGARLVGCSLELGGKNVMIVLDDADLDRAAKSAVPACFANSGQVCMCTERLYVDQSVYDEFLRRLLKHTKELRQENRYDFNADVGSLTSARQLEAVSNHVEDAKAKGATVLAGGFARPDVGPFCYAPTVLADVRDGMLCATEETFGPVVSVYPVTGEEEALAKANAGEYGLNASVFTRDTVRGRQLAARLRAGAVNVNDAFVAAYGSMDSPMGGMGKSGLGRRHGEEGILKYTEAQTVAVQRVGMFPPRWVPYRVYGKVLAKTLAVLRMAGIR